MSQIINPERRDPGYLKNKADVGLSKVDNYSLSEIQDIVHGALREEYASGEIYRVDELLAGKSVEIPLIQFVSNGDSKASIFIGLVDSNYNVLYYCKANIRHSNKNATYPDGDSKFNVSFELSPTRLLSDSISLRYYASTTFPIVSLYLKEELRQDSIIGVLINQIPELIVEDRSYKNSVKFLNPEENIETFIDEGLNPDLTVFVFNSERTVSSEAKSLSIYKNEEQYFPPVNEKLTQDDLDELDFPEINGIPFTGDKGLRYSPIDGNSGTRKITIAAKHTLKDESVGLEKAGAHKWEVLTEIPEVSYLGTSASTETKSRWEESSKTGLCRLVNIPDSSSNTDDFWSSVKFLQELVNVNTERDENVVSYGFLREYTNRLVKVFGILINNSGVAIKTVLLYEYVPEAEVDKETYAGKTPLTELNYLPVKDEDKVLDYVLVYPCAESTNVVVKEMASLISIRKDIGGDFGDSFEFSSHDGNNNNLHSYIRFQIRTDENFYWDNGKPAEATLELKTQSDDKLVDSVKVVFPKLTNNCIFKKNSLGGVTTGIAFSKNIIYQLDETSYFFSQWDWTFKAKTAEDNLFIKQESSNTHPIINIYLPHPEDFDYYNGIKLWGYTFLPSISNGVQEEGIGLIQGSGNIKFTNFEQPEIDFTTYEEKNNSSEVYQFPVIFERIEPKNVIWSEKEELETKIFYNADNKPLLELNSYYREPLPKFKFKDNFRLRTTWEKKGSEWRIYLDNSFLENKGETNPSVKFNVTYSLGEDSASQISSILKEKELTASFDDKGNMYYTDENSNKVSILEGSELITGNHKLYCEVNDPLWKNSYPLQLKNKKVAFDFSGRSIYDPVGNLKLELRDDAGASRIYYYWNDLRREEDKEFANVVIDNTNRRIFLYVYTCMEDKFMHEIDIKDPFSLSTNGNGDKIPATWVSGKASLFGSLNLFCKADIEGTIGYWVQVGELKNNAALNGVSSGTYEGTQQVLFGANGKTFSKPTEKVIELFTSVVGSSIASSIYGYCTSSVEFKLYTSSDQKNPIYYDWDNNSFTYDIYLGYGKKEYKKASITTPGGFTAGGELELKK